MRYLLMELVLLVVTGSGVKSPTTDFQRSINDFNNSIKELRNVQIADSTRITHGVCVKKESK